MVGQGNGRLRTMPLIARELTAIEVSRLKTPGFYMVGGVAGLCLKVITPTARSWILRASISGKRREMGLGSYPGVTLAQARDKAREARAKIEQGIDPLLEREKARSTLLANQANAVTFKQAAEKLIETKSLEWSNSKHAQQWANSMTEYAFPIIGQMHVEDIQQIHVMQVLEPIWLTKTETATRVRQRIEVVLDWAKVRGHRKGENPARWKGHLETLLPAPRKVTPVRHHPAVPINEVAKFFGELKERQGTAARALEFLTLTASRTNETLGATWKEFDLDEGHWTIPAERMKSRVSHRVPLTPAMVKILQEAAPIAGSDLVFTAPRGGKFSDAALSAVMKRMGWFPCVPHGLRSTFRDWAAERTNFPRDLAEKALAHKLENDTEAAYQRGDMLERRRVMMVAWAEFLNVPYVKDEKVVSMRSKQPQTG